MVPTEGRPAVELMMAVWSPGFYRVEDYARKVEGLSARTPDGMALEVEATRKNRWRIANKGGAAKVVVSYRLTCDRRSVTMNWVAPDLVVLNGAAAFVTTVEPDGRRRPHEVRLELPARMPAVGDRDGRGPRRPPGPLPRRGLRHAGRFADRRRQPVDPRVRRSRAAGTSWWMPARSASGTAAWRRGTWRRWSARPGGSGASSRSGATSSSTSSAAAAAGWSTRTRPC